MYSHTVFTGLAELSAGPRFLLALLMLKVTFLLQSPEEVNNACFITIKKILYFPSSNYHKNK